MPELHGLGVCSFPSGLSGQAEGWGMESLPGVSTDRACGLHSPFRWYLCRGARGRARTSHRELQNDAFAANSSQSTGGCSETEFVLESIMVPT